MPHCGVTGNNPPLPTWMAAFKLFFCFCFVFVCLFVIVCFVFWGFVYIFHFYFIFHLFPCKVSLLYTYCAYCVIVFIVLILFLYLFIYYYLLSYYCICCTYCHCSAYVFFSAMVYSEYKKQRILHYFFKGYKAPTISRILEKEKLWTTREGIVKFLRKYKETGSVARTPGSGPRSKVTAEIRARRGQDA